MRKNSRNQLKSALFSRFAFAISAIGLLIAGSLDCGAVDPRIPYSGSTLAGHDSLANTEARKAETLSIHSRRVQTVYSWDIPIEEATEYVSEFLDPEMARAVQIEREGKKYVRLFAVDDPSIPFRELVKRIGPPHEDHLGVRMLSKATYYVWNPSDPRLEPFFVKMQRFWEDKRAPIVNHAGAAKNAVLTNDIIEGLLLQKPLERSDGSILPERFGASIERPGGLSYANVIRKARPRGQGLSKTTSLYPTHATLNSNLVDDFAKKAGLSREAWIEQRYLPALARHLVAFSIERGIFLEDHTQNLILEVDRATGNLIAIHSRDLQDGMIDPVTVALEKMKMDSKKGLPANLLNEVWTDVAAARDVKNPGKFFSSYPIQSVIDFVPFKNHSLSFRMMGTFLKEYLAAIEKSLGQPIALSAQSRAFLSQFLKFDPSNFRPEKWNEVEIHDEHYRRSATIMQEIYEKTIAIRFQSLQKELSLVPELQYVLKKAYLDPKTRKNRPISSGLRLFEFNTQYLWDGHGIWAYHSKTGALRGYGYQVPQSHLDEILKITAKHSPFRSPARCLETEIARALN